MALKDRSCGVEKQVFQFLEVRYPVDIFCEKREGVTGITETILHDSVVT